MSTLPSTSLSSRDRASRRGFVLVLIAALCWGTSGVSGRIVADRAGLGPLDIAWHRMAIGAAVLLALHLLTRRRRAGAEGPLTRGTAVRLLLVGAGLAVYQLAYFAAVATAGVSIATLVALGLAPLLIALGAALLGHGRPDGTTLVALVVALVGLVLLVALGSDYNVFIAGRIRSEARRRRLREAIAVAAPQASRAITVAGLTLAATFALLTIISLRPFRELGILLTVGVLVDALVVRPLLIPALISLLGRAAWWPSRPIKPVERDVVLGRLARLTGGTEEQAGPVADATLRTLGERIGARQARELGAHLPDELAAALRDPDGCEPFGYEEFIGRVAEREGVDRQTAARDAAAVMACLIEVVPETELDYVRAALSEDYRPLLGDVAPEAPVA